jgi:hypothetical protein
VNSYCNKRLLYHPQTGFSNSPRIKLITQQKDGVHHKQGLYTKFENWKGIMIALLLIYPCDDT